jgi:hypothetical protein
MARWLISQGDRQFAARDLAELKQLATDGRLLSSDMIQPPGASEWLYAAEIPELKGLLKEGSGADGDDDDWKRRGGGGRKVAILVLLGLLGAGGFGLYQGVNDLPDYDTMGLLDNLELTEMLVTQPQAPLLDAPSGAKVGTLVKDSKLQLMGKQGLWYQVRNEGGQEGYVQVDHVVPGYFFADKRTQENYDPVYNPDRYVFVKNSSWLQLDEQNRNLTIFQFLLQNKSKFAMTDIILLATIKDKDDKVLEEVQIAIEGEIPPYDSVMVGTLSPETRDREGVPRNLTQAMFDALADEDPELQLRYSAGVEVEMQTPGFTEANIDLLQLRGIPMKDD